jgi:hypothetical protein
MSANRSYVVKVQKLTTDWIEVAAPNEAAALKQAESQPRVVAALEVRPGTVNQFFRDTAWATS